MDAAPTLRMVREHFASGVREILERVPTDIAESAVGHAVLAETLVQIAADILGRQGNSGLLDHLVRRVTWPAHGIKPNLAGGGLHLL